MRTDIHSPSKIRPEDYSYVGAVYFGPMNDELDDMVSNLHSAQEWDAARVALDKGPVFNGNFKRKGTCDHCGAWFLYGMVYRHEPSGEHICVGHTCAAETLDAGNREALDVKRLKKQVAAARKLKKLRENAAAWLAKNCPDLEPVLGFEARPGHHILKDIRDRLWNRYPSLSYSQIKLVRKILGEIEEKAEEARRAPPAVDAESWAVPAGKGIRVRGKVLVTKWKPGYGYYSPDVLKMLVLDDHGFKLWGTVPAAIEDIEKGDYVDLIANIEPSKDDLFFGFFKRPRKAVRRAAAQ